MIENEPDYKNELLGVKSIPALMESDNQRVLEKRWKRGEEIGLHKAYEGSVVGHMDSPKKEEEASNDVVNHLLEQVLEGNLSPDDLLLFNGYCEARRRGWNMGKDGEKPVLVQSELEKKPVEVEGLGSWEERVESANKELKEREKATLELTDEEMGELVAGTYPETLEGKQVTTRVERSSSWASWITKLSDGTRIGELALFKSLSYDLWRADVKSEDFWRKIEEVLEEKGIKAKIVESNVYLLDEGVGLKLERKEEVAESGKREEEVSITEEGVMVRILKGEVRNVSGVSSDTEEQLRKAGKPESQWEVFDLYKRVLSGEMPDEERENIRKALNGVNMEEIDREIRDMWKLLKGMFG